MRIRTTGPMLLSVLLLSSVGGSADDGFARYQVILSRKPFGDAPPPEKAEPPPKPQAESFAKTLRMFSITKPDDGDIRVGIIDQSNQRTYVLHVGETHPDGITLVSADFAEEEAVLRKDEENALMKLKDGGAATPLSSPAVASGTAAKPAAATYTDRRAERRRDRLERARKAAKERQVKSVRALPKYDGVELRAHLQEYNMEVIRKGMPPLPIELTPNQDDQLVREGVLPPREGQELLAIAAPIPEQEAAAGGLPPLQEGLEKLADTPLDQLTAEDLKNLEKLGVFD